MKLWPSNWKSGLVALVMSLYIGPAACGDASSSDEPARPRNLAAELFKSGIHLTWRDASDNEDYFMVERAARSSATVQYDDTDDLSAMPMRPSEVQAFGHHFFELVKLPENAEDYLDTKVDSGMTYFYRIKAVNDAGSATSDEIEVAFP